MPSQMQHSAVGLGRGRLVRSGRWGEGEERLRRYYDRVKQTRVDNGGRSKKEGQLPVVPDGEVINMAIDERSAAATI